MKDEFMKICMSSLCEIDLNEFEDALTLKTQWSLWIIENKECLWNYVYDSRKLIDEIVYVFYEAWPHDMNDI